MSGGQQEGGSTAGAHSDVLTNAPAAAKPRTEGNWLQSILVALALALAIRHFIVQAYKIPSGSMIPSLLIGDQLIASKLTYGIRLPGFSQKLVKFAVPERGEIVVFRFPEDPSKDFIKRVMAVPGDRIRIDDGMIYVNDQPLPRQEIGRFDYITEGGSVTVARRYRETNGDYSYDVLYSTGDFHAFWDMEEIQLGPEQLFVMGDNRDHSNDSRFWGPVDLDLLEGQPLFIHFSWDHINGGIRWHRIGTRF